MPADRKVVVLTGATRGLGRALVDRFHEAGWRIVGCGTKPEAVADLAATYPQHRFDVVDVGDCHQVSSWAESVIGERLTPDLLINNAAVMNSTAPLWEIDPGEFERLMQVNVSGVYFVTRAFVPEMIERRQGVIVNLSSGWGRSTSAKVAPYCASKYAIEGLTLALAQELPRGMAAIPLNPGVIDTDMLRSCFGGGASAYPEADEWSRVAAPFLMSLGARHNGQSLTVPGQ
jgi:NAD(P)-dependent dehydrogenase (short-subunit alcohol dehydrogenase family)